MCVYVHYCICTLLYMYSFNVEMRPTDVMSVEPASPYRDLTFKRSGDTVSYLEVSTLPDAQRCHQMSGLVALG